MKAEFFKVVCPLEIGDTVAIKATKDGETKEALYLPQGCTVITTAAVALHKVTDIATLHYLKKSEIQFLYELDACGKYEPLTVKVPVREFAEELKLKRTAKTITYAAVQHAGRYNERKEEPKTVKVRNWDGREVFFAGSQTVEA